MRKRFYIIIFVVFLLVFLYSSCDNLEEGESFSLESLRVSGEVVSEEDGEPIGGIEVKFEDTLEMKEYRTQTDENGRFELEIDLKDGRARGFFKINFDMRKNYIPVLLVDDSSTYELTLTPEDDKEEIQIKVDLLKKWNGKYNPENYAWFYYLSVYRGRGGGIPTGLNQVWVKQPEKFIVYDPHHYLDEYDDKKDNPVFDDIYRSFRAIEDYTDGVIKAPKREDIEIRESGGDTDYAVYFEITDGDAWSCEDVNSNNEIVKSCAGAGYDADIDTIGEIIDSVQGGDNEGGYIYSVVGGAGKITKSDRLWGKLNYKKREPGSRIILALRSPFGFLIETRLFKKLKK